MYCNPCKLYRYSKKKWLEDSLCKGRFRLNSATHIKALENDSARQDDEMKVVQVLPKEGAKIYNLSKGVKIIPSSDIIMTDEISSDYYMLCLSYKRESYLFDIFKGVNACLIIHDVEEFRKRIYLKTNLQLPRWDCVDKNVKYGGICEYRLGPLFVKPVQYAFQFEWRFVWSYPGGVSGNLIPMYFEIGNIEDIAELVDRF